MMKQIIIIVLAASLIVACSKKVTPAVTSKKEAPAAPVLSDKPVPPRKMDANARINRPLLVAGQKVFENNCGKCHDLKKPEEFTQERWIGIIRWMGPKAKLTEEEKTQALAYVQFNAKDAPKDHSNM